MWLWVGTALHFNSTHALTYCIQFYWPLMPSIQATCVPACSGLAPLNESTLQLGNPQHSSPLKTSHHPGPFIFTLYFFTLKLIRAWVFLELHYNARIVRLLATAVIQGSMCKKPQNIHSIMYGWHRRYFDYLMLIQHRKASWPNPFPRGKEEVPLLRRKYLIRWYHASCFTLDITRH